MLARVGRAREVWDDESEEAWAAHWNAYIDALEAAKFRIIETYTNVYGGPDPFLIEMGTPGRSSTSCTASGSST